MCVGGGGGGGYITGGRGVSEVSPLQKAGGTESFSHAESFLPLKGGHFVAPLPIINKKQIIRGYTK